MAASKTHPWAGRSSAGCSSPRFLRCSLFQRFSAFCKDFVATSRRELFMPQTDNSRHMLDPDLEVQSHPDQANPDQAHSDDVPATRRPRKQSLVLAVAVLAVAALLVSGIWSRVSASTALRIETAQAALPAVAVVSPKQNAPA